jgi:hypothetical protein
MSEPKTTKKLRPVTVDHLRRIANIMGPASAAAKALGDMDARRRAGQDPRAYWTGTTILIGPALDA